MIANLANKNWPVSQLGESPHWDSRTKLLWWVDIEGKALHCADTSSGNVISHAAPDLAAFAIPLQESVDRVLVGLADTICVFEPAKGTYQNLATLPQDAEKFRFNDGKCDPAGRLWAGTMPRDPETNDFTSGLFYMSARYMIQRLDGVGVSNGKGWSPDGRTMYHADTARRHIKSYFFDPATGSIEDEKIFLEMDEKPDGLCVDMAGMIYIACFGAGRVLLCDAGGRICGHIDVPVLNVTACCFGDEDLKSLYITTAAGDNGAAGGQIYRCRLDTPGQPSVPAVLAPL